MLKIGSLLIVSGKDGMEMIAMLYAQQIMLGKKKFSDVPARFKDEVREILIDSGKPELAEE